MHLKSLRSFQTCFNSTNIYANMAEIRQNDATRHSTSVSTTGPFVNGVKSSELVTASPYIMTSSVTGITAKWLNKKAQITSI